MSLEEGIETLNYFGLSCNQAKVYLAIGSSKFFTVREIQRKAEVPRQEIYRILAGLEELGLVEKTIKRPLRYKGIPLNQGVRFLLDEKIQETKKMERKAEKIIENFHLANNNVNGKDIEPNFVLIPKSEGSMAKRREEIDGANVEIDFISSWKRLPHIINVFKENAKKALERDVKIRVILEKPEDLDQIPKEIKEFQKNPKYKLRYILKPPNAIVGIFDKKRAMVKTSASINLEEAPTLWTDNPCFLSILSDYFELMWITAMEHTHEQICQ